MREASGVARHYNDPSSGVGSVLGLSLGKQAVLLLADAFGVFFSVLASCLSSNTVTSSSTTDQ
jgi:hypothetical protein